MSDRRKSGTTWLFAKASLFTLVVKVRDGGNPKPSTGPARLISTGEHSKSGQKWADDPLPVSHLASERLKADIEAHVLCLAFDVSPEQFIDGIRNRERFFDEVKITFEGVTPRNLCIRAPQHTGYKPR